MVFATGSLVNANTSEVSEAMFNDCASEAWNYGIKNGGGNEKIEYLLMDAYYVGCVG
ncbi:MULTISPECIES: succinate dehydrogenase [Tenacibaculum]|uniref:Uncharacterized protein n=2 Tax=Tenacibaculum TaxID=104267 RepID=A0A2I2LEY9_9FLAO|nr:succinate dehydrogenase [Tenacibaculum finnmarkense]MBE7696800.1 succinate dehydrogenase [Tenacibaculum finnmarkense genomovar ulcerans]SOS58144.1 conserved hypothetical protein [Tenacibaculum finnmarkense genomovar ulcerans]